MVKVKDQRIEMLEKRVLTLEQAVDDAEQYSRRTSLRVTGLAEKSGEDPCQVAMTFFNEVMEINPPLESRDLDRVHRVGPRSEPKSSNRKLLVKFANYQARDRVYRARRLLRQKDRSIFIYEDLTKQRATLCWKARCAKREKKIQDTWTFDGNVYVKDLAGCISPRLKTEEDLRKTYTTPTSA